MKEIRQDVSQILAYWRLSKIKDPSHIHDSCTDANCRNVFALLDAGANLHDGLPSYALWRSCDCDDTDANIQWWESVARNPQWGQSWKNLSVCVGRKYFACETS